MKEKGIILQKAWADLVSLHHEAILVQTLGVAAAGVSPERVVQMLAEGLINTADLQGIIIDGMEHAVDPLQFMYRVAKIIEGAPPGDRPAMRQWGVDQWKTSVDHSIRTAPEKPATLPESAIRVGIPRPPTNQPAGGYDVPIPEWMSTGEAFAYQQAATRAGEFCRGLGNALENELGGALEEGWDGEAITEEVDAVQRTERMDVIREAVAEALATHRDYQALALELARKTGNYAHNWERIARTELQGAYNEGVLVESMADWGEDARIARVPETGACQHCIRLFQNSDGTPKVFLVSEILANGTNVGKRTTSWLPTIWPVHPNCQCDTMNVPPGMIVSPDGILVLEE